MLEIEQKLHQLHAEARTKATTAPPGHASTGGGAAPQEEPARGLAKVNAVAQGSPAAMAVSLIAVSVCLRRNMYVNMPRCVPVHAFKAAPTPLT